MRATTLSTIRSGPAELSDWYLLDDFPPILCRVVLSLQRFTLIQTEEGELHWISAELASMLLPTEPAGEGLAQRHEGTEAGALPASDYGISPLKPAYDAWCEKEAMLQAVHTSIAMGYLDDPGTPPDLR